MDDYRMLLVVYNTLDGADQLYDRLGEMEDDDILDIEDAAVIVKDHDGSLSVDDKDDVSGGSGALAGAIAGGLIGLLAGPGGAIVGAVAGAATGGTTASLVDMGVDQDVINRIKADMRPGSSALIAVVEHEWGDDFDTNMSTELDDSVSHYYHALKSEVIEQWNRGKRAVDDALD